MIEQTTASVQIVQHNSVRSLVRARPSNLNLFSPWKSIFRPGESQDAHPVHTLCTPTFPRVSYRRRRRCLLPAVTGEASTTRCTARYGWYGVLRIRANSDLFSFSFREGRYGGGGGEEEERGEERGEEERRGGGGESRVI